MSQCFEILRFLRNGQKLTPVGAYTLCGTLALHSRISELRARGHRVKCTMVEIGGKRVGRYSL